MGAPLDKVHAWLHTPRTIGGAGSFPHRGGEWGVRLRERVRLKRRRDDFEVNEVTAATHNASRRAGAWQDLSRDGKALAARAMEAVLPAGAPVPAGVASRNLLAGAVLGVELSQEERAKRVLDLERVRVAPKVPTRRRPPPAHPPWKVDPTVGADAAAFLWRRKDWAALELLLEAPSVSALREMANRWTAGAVRMWLRGHRTRLSFIPISVCHAYDRHYVRR